MLNKKSTFALLYRVVLMLTAWFGVLGFLIQRIVNGGGLTSIINLLSTFTIQSNILVAVWLTAAVRSRRKAKTDWLLRPKTRGAITVYITVTMTLYAVLLASLWQPTGLSAVLNVVTHYLVPAAFILDWFLFEERKTYQWRWAFHWLVYPLAYFAYAMIYAAITGWYIYPFFNIPEIGIDGLVKWAIILIVYFIVLSTAFIGVNKIMKASPNLERDAS